MYSKSGPLEEYIAHLGGSTNRRCEGVRFHLQHERPLLFGRAKTVNHVFLQLAEGDRACSWLYLANSFADCFQNGLGRDEFPEQRVRRIDAVGESKSTIFA